MPRHCPFHGCNLVISSTMFACKRHWCAMPEHLRNEILAAYALSKSGGIDGEELRRREKLVLDKTEVCGLP